MTGQPFAVGPCEALPRQRPAGGPPADRPSSPGEQGTAPVAPRPRVPLEPGSVDGPAGAPAAVPPPVQGGRRVLVAAASRLHLQLFVSHVDRVPGRRCVASTDDLERLVTTSRVAEVDLVVLVAHGLAAHQVGALVRDVVQATGLGVVVVAPGGDPDHLATSLQAGARGYVTETSGLERLDQALDTVGSGGISVDPAAVSGLVHDLVRGGSDRRPGAGSARLTGRELEVLRLLVDGASTYSIASGLGMSAHTARTHIKAIMSKLGTHTRLQAAAVAVQLDLV